MDVEGELLVSGLFSGQAQMKESVPPPEESKGKMEAYKKEMEKELRALDTKMTALSGKVKKEGSKVAAEAKGSWEDLNSRQSRGQQKPS